ncbi:reverse transcriptase domain-containing protein [Enterococcus durans]|uniref:reverse transcriptase domain-containing protein n=1 Tax=Enterococcus durans TaxID=53345 RepID=UPI0039A5726B
MRNPEIILNNLIANSKKSEYRFQRLYRNLFNEEFFLIAYGKLAPNSGNLTEGISKETIDGFKLEKITKLIEDLKNERYQPKPVKRIYIPKKNGKQRPLGIPTFEDKLVQEVVRMLLEAIYEGKFSNQSHGFRPNRSCHTALKQIQHNFIGSKWFIEGDICSFFDTIDHHIMIQVLRKQIDDERFIRLIWKFLRAGYLEEWKFHKTYSGMPQGGIISPILSNIYLNELDSYMNKYRSEFNSGKRRKRNPEYEHLKAKMDYLQQKINKLEMNSNQRHELILQFKALKKQRSTLPSVNFFDPEFKRLSYTRYADDFIIGVIGSKEEALAIKYDIETFLRKELHIELSADKTLITHSSNTAKFLGYHLTVSRDTSVKKNKNGKKMRPYNGKCLLFIPKENWVNKLKELGAMKIEKNGVWKPVHRGYLLQLSDIEILSIYNAEIRGFYNYYQLANNMNVLNKFMYFMKYSMYKTFAGKYNSSITKIAGKYIHSGLFCVSYRTKNGKKTRTLYHHKFKKSDTPIKNSSVDGLPNTLIYRGRTELTQRLLANQCEWCGSTEGKMEVHHIKKLKDLKGKSAWERKMIARNRKTMVLCESCHKKLHAGKLD